MNFILTILGVSVVSLTKSLTTKLWECEVFLKTIGIVSEYNPFHNGHKYHIEESKRQCGAEAAVCIMSGSFVQRGEPAMFDKWSRAKMAVLGGADLVIELPFVYACQSAEIFSHGAIKILNAFESINYLCFGSELGKTDKLFKMAELLINEPPELQVKLKEFLSEGHTYPKAVSLALAAYYSSSELPMSDIINTPNNVLGIEYIKSLMQQKSPIQPHAILRIANNYNDTEIKQPIASATAVRRELKGQGFSGKAKTSLPAESHQIIKELMDANKALFLDDFSDLILYRLRVMKDSDYLTFFNTKEGIENRLKKAAASSSNCENLIEKVKTKRYTRTFIQRLLIHILLDLKSQDVVSFKNPNNPAYIRVLCFNDKGKSLLNKIKKDSIFPIITKVASYKPQHEVLEKMFAYDIKATDIYNLGYKTPDYKLGGADFYKSPIYL